MSGFPLFTQPSVADISTKNTNSPHTMTIGSLTSRRIVLIDPFIESFNFKVSKKTEFKKFDAVSSQGGVLEEPSEISISITMNLPAATSNASRVNKLKIQELQTMIGPAIGKKNNTAIILVYMKNLIARYPSKHPCSDFDSLAFRGLPCHISSIDYTPDFDVGFFNDNLPKNIKLSLELKIINQKLNLTQNGLNEEYDYRFAHSFVDNGMYQQMDLKGFPFGYSQFNSFEVGLGTERDISQLETYTGRAMSSLNSKSKTFIMFTNHIEEQTTDAPAVDDSALTTLNEIAVSLGNSISMESVTPEVFLMRQASNESVKIARWVAFEPFISNINRTIEVEHATKQVGQGAFSTGYESTVPKHIKYSVDFDVVAGDIKEAKINLAKLNTLFRLSSAPTKEKFIHRELMIVPERKTGYAKTIKVLIPGFIQAGNNPITKKTSISQSTRRGLLDYCVDLHVYSVDFDIDDDIGFFEEEGVLLPKGYKVKMELYSKDTGITNSSYENPTANINNTNEGGSGNQSPQTTPTPTPQQQTPPSAPTEVDTSPTSPTFVMTRVQNPDDNPDPNIHYYDVDGDGDADIYGIATPESPEYSGFVNVTPEGNIPAVNLGTNTVYPHWAPSPGSQIEVYVPEDPNGKTQIGPPATIGANVPTTSTDGTSASDPEEEVGSGTETSNSDATSEPNGQTSGGGYYSYDPDYAY